MWNLECSYKSYLSFCIPQQPIAILSIKRTLKSADRPCLITILLHKWPNQLARSIIGRWSDLIHMKGLQDTAMGRHLITKSLMMVGYHTPPLFPKKNPWLPKALSEQGNHTQDIISIYDLSIAMIWSKLRNNPISDSAMYCFK